MRCRACGATSGSAARFCDQCGARLDLPASPGPVPAEAADRRIVTALFADLVDYVRLVAEHDPEDVRRWVDAALRTMARAIEAYGGTREKFIGDAVFAVFGWPNGHDDDALRATHCAIAIRAGLAEADDPVAANLKVRIGIATGEVVAAHRETGGSLDWSLTGPAVTTAARIQDLAGAGEILLDETTQRAARKGLEVEDLGPQLLRGQSRPIRLGRLLADDGFQPWRPPAGELVGRAIERDWLRSILAGVERSARGATVIIEGEAGIGKSRLLADLESDARLAGFAWTWVDNVSYGTSEPYRFGRALAQAVADEHGTDSGSFARRLLFTADAAPDDVRRWGGAIAKIARDAAFSGWEAESAHAPSDPAEVVASMMSVARRYVERLIEVSGPRVLVIDDLHWVDPASASMIEALVEITTRLPLVIVVGTRPGLEASWTADHHVVRIGLAGLDADETAELAGAIARATVPPADADVLHARTAGNPLFIVETVRAFLEEGTAAVDDGTLSIADASGGAVPTTLRALLGARIDALSEDARRAIRVASVLGMTFRAATLAEILDQPIGDDVLDRLAAASLIVPAESGAWRFVHPLIHDVAYAGLLASRRRELHARVADHLEARSPVRIDVVARHRAASGDPERALPLLVQAAEAAMRVGAPAEAATFWTMAAELVPDDPREAGFRQRAGEALEAGAMPGA